MTIIFLTDIYKPLTNALSTLWVRGRLLSVTSWSNKAYYIICALVSVSSPIGSDSRFAIGPIRYCGCESDDTFTASIHLRNGDKTSQCTIRALVVEFFAFFSPVIFPAWFTRRAFAYNKPVGYFRNELAKRSEWQRPRTKQFDVDNYTDDTFARAR